MRARGEMAIYWRRMRSGGCQPALSALFDRGEEPPQRCYGQRVRQSDVVGAIIAGAMGEAMRLAVFGAAGRWIVTVVPTPTSLAMLMTPPCASTSPLAMASPRPVPPLRCEARARAGSAR